LNSKIKANSFLISNRISLLISREAATFVSDGHKPIELKSMSLTKPCMGDIQIVTPTQLGQVSKHRKPNYQTLQSSSREAATSLSDGCKPIV
jgi:hypothetical protein